MAQVISASPQGTIASVSGLKQSLAKELTKLEKYQKDNVALSSAFYERCLDILNELDKLPVDLSVLSKTLIGTVVSKFKKCSDENVSSKAKQLVKKWKNIASKDGASNASPQATKSSKPAQSPSKPGAAPRRLSVPKPAPRRVSVQKPAPAQFTAPTPPEWESLPNLRKNICRKFYEVFATSKGAKHSEERLIPTCTNMEAALQTFSRNDTSTYKEKARSLMFNLKRNEQLRYNLVEGDVDPSDLMNMTPEQLATAEKKAEREKLEKDIQDSRRLDWEQANEDKINDMCGIKGDLLNASLFTCGRCKSIKTTSTQKQTRSADEPMTVFVLCMNCGNRWKC